MKNKKGFTLVELIAVIALLGVILTIAGLSITKIKEEINKRQRLNLRATLVAASQGYHDETGVNIVPIEVLIQIGAVQADTTNYEGNGYTEEEKYNIGDSVILDPVDNIPINCDAIVYDEKGKGTYSEEHGLGCTTEARSENSVILEYKINDGEYKLYQLEDNKWLNETPIYFKAQIMDAENDNITWRNLNAPDMSVTGDTYELPVPDGYVNAKYRLEANIKDTYVYKDFNVKVDTKAPVISNISIVQETEIAKEKKITAVLTDNESGLAAYKLVKDSGDNPCGKGAWLTINDNLKTSNITPTVKENGKYIICVRDVAGNISKSNSGEIEVKTIDNKAPTMTVSVPEGDTWKKEKTATITITDEGDSSESTSGLKESITIKYDWKKTNQTVKCSDLENTATITTTRGSKSVSYDITINGKTGKGKIYVCPDDVTDILGNTISNDNDIYPISEKMYLDNTVPTSNITITSGNESYNTPTVTIKVGGSDSDSGIEYYCFTTTNNSSECDWKKSNTFNVTVSSTYDGTSQTYYGWTKDQAKNISSSSYKTYEVYTSCKDKTEYDRSGWSECTESCGGGTRYKTIKYKDSHLNNVYCPDDKEEESCNTESCCDASFSESIGDFRYKECTKVYIVSCQSDCNASPECKDASGGTHPKKSLTISKTNCSCDYENYSSCEIVHTKCEGDTFIWTDGYGGGFSGIVQDTETLYVLDVRDTDVLVRTKEPWGWTHAFVPNDRDYGYIYKACINIYAGRCNSGGGQGYCE